MGKMLESEQVQGILRLQAHVEDREDGVYPELDKDYSAEELAEISGLTVSFIQEVFTPTPTGTYAGAIVNMHCLAMIHNNLSKICPQ